MISIYPLDNISHCVILHSFNCLVIKQRSLCLYSPVHTVISMRINGSTILIRHTFWYQIAICIIRIICYSSAGICIGRFIFYSYPIHCVKGIKDFLAVRHGLLYNVVICIIIIGNSAIIWQFCTCQITASCIIVDCNFTIRAGLRFDLAAGMIGISSTCLIFIRIFTVRNESSRFPAIRYSAVFYQNNFFRNPA